MRPFIGTDDLSAITGTVVTDENLITAIALDAGCQAVRSYIGQTINYVEDDIEEIDGRDRKVIRLKERPVRDLTSIMIDGVELDPLKWNLRGALIRRTDGFVFPIGYGNVEVIYSHGWDAIPDDSAGDDVLVPADLRLVALLSAKRVLLSVGVTVGDPSSETIGSYSYTLPTTAIIESASELFGAEKAVLDHYRISETV